MTPADASKGVAATANFTFEGCVVGLTFLNDGMLAVALGSGAIRIVEPGSASEPLSVRPHAPNAAVLATALDVDGAGMLTGGDDGKLFRINGKGIATLLTEFPKRQLDVIAVNTTAGLRGVAAGRELRLLDKTGKHIGTTSDHPSTVTGIAFQPKGKRVAAAHYGGATLWWTSSLGKNARRLSHRGSHIGITWSPDGSTVVSSLQENELYGRNLDEEQDLTMRGYPTKVRAMDWMAKPMTLVTSGASAVIGWKFSGGGPKGKPPLEIASGVGRLVTAIAVRSRTRYLAIGYDDGRVAVCSADEKDETVDRIKPSDGDQIAAMAWSTDGTWLAVGSQGGAVSLFFKPGRMVGDGLRRDTI